MNTLYYLTGTCSLAVHIMLNKLSIPYQLKLIKLLEGEGQTPEYKAVSPLGKVPVLDFEGERLREVSGILLTLAERHPDSQLLPEAGSQQRHQAYQWLSFVATELHCQFTPAFLPQRYTTGQELDEVKEASVQRLHQRFAILEQHFANQPFLIGEQLYCGDYYLYVVLSWMGRIGIDLSEYKSLWAYYQRMDALPEVVKTRAIERENMAA
tara:strand:+ start:8588 stop:9217 length:630 start_codon:yes stop_codon:yes gene_type:complete